MKYSSFYLSIALAMTVCHKAWPKSCQEIQVTGLACFDAVTLGECYKNDRNEWTGKVVVDCIDSCCNAESEGCDPIETGTECEASSETTLAPCISGTVRTDDTSCDSYFYCAGGTWHPSKCPNGSGFDDFRKQCAIGYC